MFLKQYAYKPRSNSQSSQGSSGGVFERTDKAAGADSSPAAKTAATQNAGAGATGGGNVSAAIAGRRRSSISEGKFAGLNNYKRTSHDEGAAARKASWAEQKPGSPGLLGGMWNNFTKGS